MRKELEYLKDIKLLRTENREQYVTKQPKYHPSTQQYKDFKIGEIKKCIYGIWGKESGGYRWMPPFGYFYTNYVWIKDEKDKEQIVIKPKYDDLEWMLFYMYAECYGFSGFELDEEYSCDEALINQFEFIVAEVDQPDRIKSLYKPDGTLKTYKKTQDYLYELKDKELGKPLWWNNAKDAIIMGSRGAGKSYSLIGLTLWLLCLDGTKKFSKEFADMRISANIVMGSADNTSLDTFTRGLKEGMNYLLTEEDLGVYKYKANGIEDVPLLGRHMLGTVTNNWRYRYIVNGQESGGTGSSFTVVAYSPNKKGGGTTAAASQRVTLSIVDEVGKLQVSAISVWGSNRALTMRKTKFGSQIFAGTSGNMDLVKDAKEMFENPKNYDMVSYSNPYEHNGVNEIGFFIPAFMTKRSFKDKDGNTNLDIAVEYYIKELEKCTTSKRLLEQKMNFPLVPSDMWITKTDTIFPVEEAKEVKRKLLANDRYKKERTLVEIFWDSTKPNGVRYEIVPENKGNTIDFFKDSQGGNDKKNKQNKSTITNTIIYEFPENDPTKTLYKFVGVDPYVSDELEGGESMGALLILKNPGFQAEGIQGDIIVAEIFGKYNSRREFNERAEKLIALYGNNPRSIMFESNRGEDIKEYFMKKGKEHLLALTPVKHDKVIAKVKLDYGFRIGNDISKAIQLEKFANWLLEMNVNDGVPCRNIELIKSIGLLDEIIEYDSVKDREKKANYDRISAFLGCLIARRENYNELISNEDRKNKNNLNKMKDNKYIKKLNDKLIRT